MQTPASSTAFVETLSFDDPTLANALFGPHNAHLNVIAERTGADLSTRGTTLAVTSDDPALRERIPANFLVMTARLSTARRLGLMWGVHAVHTRDITNFEEMIAKSKRMALRHQMAGSGDRLVVMAGVPFGVPGSTNVLHVVRVVGDELHRRTQH